MHTKRSNGRRRRPKRQWTTCPVTHKERLGERKDAKLALEAAWHLRARAELDGRQSGWTVCREYACEHCGGWHLTSLPTRSVADAS